MLGEHSRMNLLNAKLNSLQHESMKTPDLITSFTSEFRDLLTSPRGEISNGTKELIANAWKAHENAKSVIFPEAEKDGIPIKKLGGIPSEALDEYGVYNSDKGKEFAEKYHKQEAEQEAKSFGLKEEAKYNVMLKSKEAFQQFLIDSGIKLPKQQVVTEFERAKIARKAGLIPTGLDEKGVLKYGIPRATLPGEEEPQSMPSAPTEEPPTESPVQPMVLNDDSVAMQYFNAAGGDKNKAREMARKDGYTF
jgi:hypothetical protein